MKALIVSDNHGDKDILNQLVVNFAHQADVLIHCGDSELPPTDPVMQHFVAVKGNNDWDADYPFNQVVDCQGTKILVTHGHRYQVNYSLTPLMLKAEEEQADIVCYGHTHQLAVTMNAGTLFINPGSISLPRGEYTRLGGTFAMVETGGGLLTVDYYDRTLKPVPELHFEFKRGSRHD